MFFSGGGVTFTGGEATLWGDELILLLTRLQELGIHTAIETNGTSPRLGEIAEHVDYLIMDIKMNLPLLLALIFFHPLIF